LEVFVDQTRNLGKAMGIGVAAKVDIKNITVDGFKKSILTVLQDPNENAKKISKLFRDKPQTPLDTATWWCEYVMRNPNLDHMKSPTIALGPFISKSYDVMLVILVVMFLTAHLLIKIVSGLKRITSGKSKVE
jgi:glucuronosyltransferase